MNVSKTKVSLINNVCYIKKHNRYSILDSLTVIDYIPYTQDSLIIQTRKKVLRKIPLPYLVVSGNVVKKNKKLYMSLTHLNIFIDRHKHKDLVIVLQSPYSNNINASITMQHKDIMITNVTSFVDTVTLNTETQFYIDGKSNGIYFQTSKPISRLIMNVGDQKYIHGNTSLEIMQLNVPNTYFVPFSLQIGPDGIGKTILDDKKIDITTVCEGNVYGYLYIKTDHILDE